ncbi:MAG: N-acetyltransferase [Deltaproteobacteria bacterium]|nr:N-acetyltransferase [Deltaproteobacteria bacterium]
MIRKACISDVKTIHKLINISAAKGEVLPRSLTDVYHCLRDFFVFLEGEEIAGICAMNIIWDNLAEIRSLYVRDKHRRKGIGSKLVHACTNEASGLGIGRLFTLTYEKEFFSQMGFAVTERTKLPEKIWADCFRCPKYPDYCDETMMVLDIDV